MDMNATNMDVDIAKMLSSQLAPIVNEKTPIRCNLVISVVECGSGLGALGSMSGGVGISCSSASSGSSSSHSNFVHVTSSAIQHNSSNHSYNSSINGSSSSSSNNNSNNNSNHGNSINNNSNNNSNSSNNNTLTNFSSPNSSNRDLIATVTALDGSFSVSSSLPMRLPTIALVDKEAAEQFVLNLVPKICLEIPCDWDGTTCPKLKMGL